MSSDNIDSQISPAHAHDDNPLRAEKRRKLHQMKELGLNPFPHNFERTSTSSYIKETFEHLATGEASKESVFKIAGRLMTKRPMGKAAFFNIQDQAGHLQAYLRKEELPEKDVQFFENIDIGDFVGIEGFVFRTQKGELSIHCQRFECIGKSLEPLPEKYHGLQDVEIKYRNRHLDLIMDPESRRVFETRSRIVSEIRNWLTSRGSLEVETPVLQPIYGGASARPFTTHHNALDMKLYLRISPELYLKRLIVGGFEKVFEISKNFRNEGIDRSHNPEFALLEWYEAYTDYKDQMERFEELTCHLVEKICGSLKINYQGKELDFTRPWKRLTVYDGIREYAKVDPLKVSDDELNQKLKGFKVDSPEKLSRGEKLMALFEFTVEEHLWQPTFVMDHPVEISPLTKMHRTEAGLVERFEPFAACMEIGNAYTELNDPEDQRNRLKQQEAQRSRNDEAHPMDEDFLHAIDVGMPPTGGVGFGVERIVMLLTDRPSIRDILLFPTMKPKA